VALGLTQPAARVSEETAVAEDARLEELLEEALEGSVTPEEVCARCPDLAPELRRRWERCRAVATELLAIFPPSDAGSDRTVGDFDGRLRRVPTSLPSIPGYELLSILGHGGMGVVYRARHVALKRFVAIKMLLSGNAANPGERARFRREAEALAALTHPHIVQVFEVGEFEGRPFFAMELVEGGCLAEELDNIPRSAAECAAMVRTLAGAVECAHRGGIVHRDLKPSNVLLTLDGAPKISDFGLARQLDGADLITLSGARVGTPSYMAPEQASKRWGEVGPPADVYALGAILYEMMTGRPPFRGESVADTERQLLSNEPASPSQLNGGVPRDLETICLKCLQKAPGRRYASAAALAEDLGRFQAGEPIMARRVGRIERAVKWARRRPAAASTLAGAAAVAISLGAGALVWSLDRSATARAVRDYLNEAARLQRDGQWAAADTAIKQAEARLGDRLIADLRARLAQGHRDSELVRRLDDIHTRSAATVGGAVPVAPTEREYAAAFREAGFGDYSVPADTVGARVAASAARPALVAALYQWFNVVGVLTEYHGPKYDWLLEVVRRADPDPTGWRDRALDRETWRDAIKAREVAMDAPLEGRTTELLLAVRLRMSMAGRDPIPFLIRVQRAHPADYWANMTLAIAMRAARSYPDAIRYAQAAVALNPRAAVAHDYLADSLLSFGRDREAAAEFRATLRCDPDPVAPRCGLATALINTGQYAEALRELDICARLDPASKSVWSNIGLCHESLGQTEQAASAYTKLVAMDPLSESQSSDSQWRLRTVLVRLGRTDEALAAWRAKLDREVPRDREWNGYVECCVFGGRDQEAIRMCGSLLARLQDSSDPRDWEVVARSCLLLPSPGPYLDRATALIDRALAAPHPTVYHPFYRVTKGLAEYRSGHYASAIAIMEGDAATALAPVPQLVAAMARAQLGQAAQARRALARIVASRDWFIRQGNWPDVWMHQVLRREAERLIFPDLPKWIDGSSQPADSDERIAMLGECQFAELHGRCSQVWETVFRDAPDLAEAHQYDAARAAAMAAAGWGRDAAKYSDADRAAWRDLSVRWLSMAVARMEKSIIDRPTGRASAAQTLAYWQTARDLAGVREDEAITLATPAQRTDIKLLWDAVATALEHAKRSN
jgi:serine/threonine-protein kinase